MLHHQMDLTQDASESSGVQLPSLSESQTLAPDILGTEEDLVEEEFDLGRAVAALLKRENLVFNAKAFISRFLQIACRPDHVAPLILDVYSLSVSILSSRRQSEVDFLYPMSSLTKRRSGRLARLILDYSKGLQQPRDINETGSSQESIDLPRVAVIDLNEVPQDVIDKGYSIPADIHGFMIMLIILQTFVSLMIRVFAPLDTGFLRDWLDDWVGSSVGEWLGSWISYLVSLAFYFGTNWVYWPFSVGLFCAYAILRGDGDLTLVRNPDLSARGHAVLLDREFTVVLTGSQSVVEAITESSFNISHPISWKLHQKGLRLGQHLCYEILKALCHGILFSLFVGFWLFLRPSSFLWAYGALVPVIILLFLSPRTGAQESTDRIVSRGHLRTRVIDRAIRLVFGSLPSNVLILVCGLAVAKESIVASLLKLSITGLLQGIPFIPFTILLISSQDFHIRTEKLFDILGNPTIRRWEFRTLAAAATFQCLMLFRNIPRPIKTVDVLGLLDVFVPDETEVWRVWKKRVADRITHEEKNNFAPTLPIFGDEHQKELKQLLDQAQLAHDTFRKFYGLDVLPGRSFLRDPYLVI